MRTADTYHEIRGVASLIGRVIDIQEWARLFPVPNRKGPGFLDGAAITQILGIRGKSWDPETFSDPACVTRVARACLESAELSPDEIDAAFFLTCTPYEVKLGQDGMRFSRDLGLRDDVVPVQLEVGCGGLARAMAVLNSLDARHVLVVAYNAVSPMMQYDQYARNEVHPMSPLLWASPAIFSDGVAAMVLSRTERPTGVCFYTRDQHRFGDGPGFTDPIVRYPGGGTLHPPGSATGEKMAAYAMSGKIIADYYNKGMVLNHRHLEATLPGYVSQMKRIYTHQAGPAMVRAFTDLVGLDERKAPTSAERLGNLVSPCTMQLLDEDLHSGAVERGDRVSFCVVGAGPERGAFVLPVNVRNVVEA